MDNGKQTNKEFETITVKKYQKLKINLKKMEATNYNHIYIIPCNGSKGWLEFAEHSALFFYYNVVDKLHLNYKFIDDSASFYNQYDIGYMHTLSTDAIVRHLKRAKLFKSIEKRGYLIAITLTKTYTKQEVAEFKAAEEARRLSDLTMKDAVNLDPKLYQTLAHLALRLHRVCNHQLDKLSSLTIGAKIVNLIDDSLATYHQTTMMKGVARSRIVEKLVRIRKNIYELNVLIKVVGDAKLLDLTVCVSISEPIVAARDLVEHDIRKLIKTTKETQDEESNQPSQPSQPNQPNQPTQPDQAR